MSAERHTEGKFALHRSKRFWGVKWTIKGKRIWNLVQTGYNRLLKGQRNVERCWWWDVWPAAKFKNWLLHFFSFPWGESMKVDGRHTEIWTSTHTCMLISLYKFKCNSNTANTVFSIHLAILHIRYVQKTIMQHAAYNQPDHIIIHRYLYANCGSSKNIFFTFE